MRTFTNRLLVMITLILVIGALGMLVRHFGSMEWIVENETRMRDFVQLYPWQGWLLGLAIYTAFSLVPGTAGKATIFGWIFGFWPAVLMVEIGLTFAALCGFFVCRFLFRDIVKSRFRRLVGNIDRHLDKDGTFYLVMMRLAHAPYSLVNYCAGATSVRATTFAWTTTVGILPGTLVFVFVGSRIPTLATISEGGVWQLLDPFLFAMLAATIVFPLLLRWSVKRFRSRDGSNLGVELAEFENLGSWPAGAQTDGANHGAS